MPNENEKPSDRELDLLKLEYEECVSSSRFFVGLRFTYFLSFITIFFILIAAFHYIWASEAKALEPLKPVIMLAIAAFGFYIVIIAIIIERRNINLYRTADNRAAFLEDKMKIKDGIRQVYAMPITERFWRFRVTHSVGIAMFYKAAAFVWILLALFSIGFGLYKIWLTLP